MNLPQTTPSPLQKGSGGILRLLPEQLDRSFPGLTGLLARLTQRLCGVRPILFGQSRPRYPAGAVAKFVAIFYLRVDVRVILFVEWLRRRCIFGPRGSSPLGSLLLSQSHSGVKPHVN